MLKIVGLAGDESACSMYRTIEPLEKLNQLKLSSTKVCNGLEPDIDQIIDSSDVVTLGRAASPKILQMIDKLHSMDKKVFFDLDDNLFDISPFSQHYLNLGTVPYNMESDAGEKAIMWKDGVSGFDVRSNRRFVNFFIQVLRQVDFVTTTTEPLRKLYSNFNSNTIVVPNSINAKLWKTEKFDRKDGKVRVLCTQAANHYPHMLWMIPILEQIQKDFPNVVLVFVGTDWKMVKSNIDYNRVEVFPWTHAKAYPYLLKTINADIGIAPINEEFFDDCRSAIKWYEFSMLGLPTVASNFGPYKREMNSYNSMLVNSEKEWYSCLSALIKYPGVRNTIAGQALKDVMNNHNLDYVCNSWYEVFNNV